LEAVRVEALGRKGALAQISKEMGKLAPEERAMVTVVGE
jgi:phenylalanyl-tRNA synthetase alpha chain